MPTGPVRADRWRPVTSYAIDYIAANHTRSGAPELSLERSRVLNRRLHFVPEGFGGMDREIRITQELAGHQDHVCLTGGDNVVRLLGSCDQADRAGRNPGLPADLLGKRHLITRCRGDLLLRP